MNAQALVDIKLDTDNILWMTVKSPYGQVGSLNLNALAAGQASEIVRRAITGWAYGALQRQFTDPGEKLECGHPKQCLGKVRPEDQKEDEHCLWCGDTQDLHTLSDSISEVFMHITSNRISKPFTKPEAVLAVADDLETERSEQAIKDEREVWDDAIRDVIADAEDPLKEMDRHAVVDRLKCLVAKKSE